jgi:hypothetical protein
MRGEPGNCCNYHRLENWIAGQTLRGMSVKTLLVALAAGIGFTTQAAITAVPSLAIQ